MLKIIQKRYFLPNICGAIRGWQDLLWCDMDGNEAPLFKTKYSALKWMDSRLFGTYYESHGEMGRPDYRVVQVGGRLDPSK